MKDFIKRRLRESLEYSHVIGDATKDKFKISEYGDYDFDDEDEYDEFSDILDMSQDKPTKQRSGIIKAYHGTPNKITNFSDEFVGGADANDQEGPGIYFTTKREEAIKYAGKSGFIYDVNLKTNNLLSDEKTHDLDYLTEPITKLIKMSPNWKQVAKSFDEGLDDMIAKYVHRTESEKEAFVGLYSDVYKGNAVAYVRNMSKLGYDGVYLPASDGGAHIVIYNPSLITVAGVKQV